MGRSSYLSKLHRWCGLFFGVWLVFVALTGTLLLYKVELLQFNYPQLNLAELPSDVDAAKVFDRYTEGYGYMPRAENPWIEVVQPDGARHYYNGNGELILERPYLNDLVGLMVEFHHHLLLHDLGKQGLGYIGLLGMVLLITGILRWWPRHWSRRLLSVRRYWPWQRGFSVTVFQLHKFLGSVLFLPVLVAMVTGTAIMYATQVSIIFTALSPQQQVQPVQAEQYLTVAPAHTWQQRLQSAKILLPQLQAEVISVTNLSIRMTYPGEWHPNGRSYVNFDRDSGHVSDVYDLRYDSQGYQFSQMIYPIHIAAVGGLVWFIIVFVGGVVLVVLPLTGLYFWCWRKFKERGRL